MENLFMIILCLIAIGIISQIALVAIWVDLVVKLSLKAAGTWVGSYAAKKKA